jgi:hypothetical protein
MTVEAPEASQSVRSDSHPLPHRVLGKTGVRVPVLGDGAGWYGTFGFRGDRCD